jgi:hypothetical protein
LVYAQRTDAPGNFAIAALICGYFGLWLIVTPYVGLIHDAQAYALQALARLDPAGLSGDVFLRFGSQDDFSLFSRVYAVWLQALGLERGATLATFACHALWYCMAYMLARRLLGLRTALISLGVLIAIPGIYGGQRVFHFAEPFMTARLPAEVLVLAALWAWHASRRTACLVLVASAMVIHPLMAAPGVLLLFLLAADSRRPAASTMPMLAALAVVAALLGSVLLRGDAAVMQSDWFATVRTRSSFLFLDRWQPADWGALSVTMATLVAASLRLNSPARSLARACLWTGLAGLALTFVAAELWHLTLLLQGQPWRWLWLARLGATVCLAPVVITAWRAGNGGRAGALLLIASWLTTAPAAAPIAGLVPAGLGATALALLWRGESVPESTARLLERGAVLVLVFVVLAGVATALPGSRDIAALGLRSALAAAIGSVVPAAGLALLTAWLVLGSSSVGRRAATVGWCGALLLAGLALGGTDWKSRHFGPEQRGVFAEWREQIPVGAEVFWWNGLRETWFLLDRRSYLSLSQSGGVVFSQPLTAELRRRAAVAQRYVDPGHWFNAPRTAEVGAAPLDVGLATELCADPALGFIVSPDKLTDSEPSVAWPTPDRMLYLHDCARWRSAAS